MQMYCMKCKANKTVEFHSERLLQTSRGEKRMANANCPDCGTKMCRILPTKDQTQLEATQ